MSEYGKEIVKTSIPLLKEFAEKSRCYPSPLYSTYEEFFRDIIFITKAFERYLNDEQRYEDYEAFKKFGAILPYLNV